MSSENDVLTPLFDSQEELSSQDFATLPNDERVWGRLYPMVRDLKVQCLIDSSYIAGRQAGCDIIFSDQCISNKIAHNVSKIHFRIDREVINNRHIVYLTDLSVNGTYLNGEKVGKGNRRMMSNKDTISLIVHNYLVYLYSDLKKANESFPEDIMKQFLVLSVLGRGAFGEVRLAFDKKTTTRFALKTVKKNRQVDVHAEARILQKVNHANVVRMLYVIDTADILFMGLELMAGGTLRELIQDTDRLCEFDVKIILYQVAHAMYYLHNQYITHRDLKPANILLTEKKARCIVKVADFGLSKMIDQSTLLMTRCGSPAYTAPEILNLECYESYTNKVDTWSYGVILYECLTLSKPFSGRNLALKIQTLSYRQSPQLFPSIKALDLIQKLLVIDPYHRYNFHNVIGHPWLKDKRMKNLVAELSKDSESESQSDTINDDNSYNGPLFMYDKRTRLSDSISP
ncbi:myosin light chain kinase A-like [Adelges cooleyi]|uniref:myosin light chain kinase A-like n=1 Tax=Adelges cooleyi TaxID=133065 RepID=UPI00217F51F6|nr:myosin light chain kinase A-like [Adelges cooleyi]XP_050426728.1 myosin light chain kinase A-like [Adelges cooleyi]XP_050426729.1 myosin light chain kinase A-like [Adelges cooleyi]XP_050426730.1 myosin light chain kinase A-like [Adelges cooleyi]